MLAASERLRKTSVFQRAYAAKNSVNSGCVTLYVLLKRSKESSNRASNQNQKNQEKHLLPRRPNQQAGSSNLPGQASTPDNQHRGPDKEPVTGSTQANRWPSNSFPLVGFSISKKVLKSACKRNRAKRRVREAMQTHQKSRGSPGGSTSQDGEILFTGICHQSISPNRPIRRCIKRSQRQPNQSHNEVFAQVMKSADHLNQCHCSTGLSGGGEKSGILAAPSKPAINMATSFLACCLALPGHTRLSINALLETAIMQVLSILFTIYGRQYRAFRPCPGLDTG